MSFGLGLILIPLSLKYLPDEKISRSISILPYYIEKDIEMYDLQIKLHDKIDILDNSMSIDEAI